MIVEDNRHMRRMLIEMMRSAFEPVTILEAANASTALTLWHEQRPELVLMDVALPDGNGIALTAATRSLLPHAKVVIVSNHRSRPCQDAARAAGAEGYVFKDEVYDTLLPTLTLVLGSRDGD